VSKHPNSLANLKKYKPGESGNPAGKPVGTTSLSDKLRKLLNENPDRSQAIVEAGVRAAEAGDFQFWKYLFDRLEGTPAQTNNLNVTGELHMKVIERVPVAIEQIVPQALPPGEDAT
jgi:hypothetical protein